jgi:DNA-binding CsgD family transcriptional regulator
MQSHAFAALVYSLFVMPTPSTPTAPRSGAPSAYPYDDRSELHKLLSLCELKLSEQPQEVHRLLHDLTNRIELTGDNFLQTKLLILKAQTQLELGDHRSTALHLRAAMLALNSCEAITDLKSEILADMELRTVNMQGSWESFRIGFERMHPQFLLTLSTRCPALTPVELKICALIRASMPTKAISEMISTSKRAIENHRYHIRQKLGLGTKDNLNTYLLCIQ